MHLKKNIAISESGFVFDPTTGDSFSLNPIGLEILELIKKDKNQAEISEVITTKYDVEPISFDHYYYDFVNMLKQLQLLESHE